LGPASTLFQFDHAGVEAQLQDVVDLAAGFFFDLFQGVDVPGVEYDRFFADHVGAYAQAEADVGVVQVVGRADAQVVQLGSFTSELFDVAVEALEFDEEIALGKWLSMMPTESKGSRAAISSLPVSLIAFICRGAM
jgi:hypothetical protein